MFIYFPLSYPSVLFPLHRNCQAQLIWAVSSNQLSRLRRTMFSRVLILLFPSFPAHPSAAAWCHGRGEKGRCACWKWTAHLPCWLYSYRPYGKHPPDHARRRCCTKERFCQRTAVPRIALVLHFYAAFQPLPPPFKRRHVQQMSAVLLQIRCPWVKATACRIRTITRGQHARIRGRCCNACASHFLIFGS